MSSPYFLLLLRPGHLEGASQIPEHGKPLPVSTGKLSLISVPCTPLPAPATTLSSQRCFLWSGFPSFSPGCFRRPIGSPLLCCTLFPWFQMEGKKGCKGPSTPPKGGCKEPLTAYFIIFAIVFPFPQHLSQRHAEIVGTGCIALLMIHLSAAKNRTSREGLGPRAGAGLGLFGKKQSCLVAGFSVCLSFPGQTKWYVPPWAHSLRSIPWACV